MNVAEGNEGIHKDPNATGERDFGEPSAFVTKESGIRDTPKTIRYPNLSKNAPKEGVKKIGMTCCNADV